MYRAAVRCHSLYSGDRTGCSLPHRRCSSLPSDGHPPHRMYDRAPRLRQSSCSFPYASANGTSRPSPDGSPDVPVTVPRACAADTPASTELTALIPSFSGRCNYTQQRTTTVANRTAAAGSDGHPVNHVTQVMIVHAGLCRHSRRQILHPTLDGMQLLGLKVLVGLVAANAIVELGERRHAQR